MGGGGWEEMGGGWEARTIELKKVRFAGGGMTARYFLSGLMASGVKPPEVLGFLNGESSL